MLLLAGALIAKGVMGFLPTLIILTTAASLGCWLSYLQGRWLGDTSVVKRWLLQLPLQYRQRAHTLFVRHGLAALLVGRFLAFVRTLLPTLAGISGLNSIRFQLFNWLSGLLWVGSVVGLGLPSAIFRWLNSMKSGDDGTDDFTHCSVIGRFSRHTDFGMVQT